MREIFLVLALTYCGKEDYGSNKIICVNNYEVVDSTRTASEVIVKAKKFVYEGYKDCFQSSVGPVKEFKDAKLYKTFTNRKWKIDSNNVIQSEMIEIDPNDR